MREVVIVDEPLEFKVIAGGGVRAKVKDSQGIERNILIGNANCLSFFVILSLLFVILSRRRRIPSRDPSASPQGDKVRGHSDSFSIILTPFFILSHFVILSPFLSF
jgi:hypothetical protein